MAKKKRSGKWMQKAVKRPGALRKTAKRMGLIKGDEKLSKSDLDKLEAKARRTGNKRLLKQVVLARTFKKYRKKKRRKK